MDAASEKALVDKMLDAFWALEEIRKDCDLFLLPGGKLAWVKREAMAVGGST